MGVENAKLFFAKLSDSQKFCPAKLSRYTVCAYIRTYLSIMFTNALYMQISVDTYVHFIEYVFVVLSSISATVVVCVFKLRKLVCRLQEEKMSLLEQMLKRREADSKALTERRLEHLW